jgi:hypothetical protein
MILKDCLHWALSQPLRTIGPTINKSAVRVLAAASTVIGALNATSADARRLSIVTAWD